MMAESPNPSQAESICAKEPAEVEINENTLNNVAIPEINKVLVERMNPDFGILDKLLALKALSRAEFAAVKKLSTSDEKNSRLLELVTKNGKLTDLFNALKDTHQEHLVNYVTAKGEYSQEYGGAWPLTERETSILDANQEALVDLLDFTGNEIISKLYTLKVLNRRQTEYICKQSYDYEKTEVLLDFLYRSSLSDYWKMITCLRDTNQQPASKILFLGGAAVRVHNALDGETQAAAAAENEIVTRIENILSNMNLEESSRILERLQLNLFAARVGHSVNLYILCETVDELMHLSNLLTTGELQRGIEMLFNQLVSRSERIHVFTTVSKETLDKCKMFLEVDHSQEEVSGKDILKLCEQMKAEEECRTEEEEEETMEVTVEQTCKTGEEVEAEEEDMVALVDNPATAPVRRFSRSERSHTTTQGNYRPLNLHPEDRKNMYPGRPLGNTYGRGFSSQGDLDVCLAKELVRRACSSEGGAVTFDRGEWEQFCKQVIRSVPSGDMDTFFHRFPHIFSCEPNPMYHPRRILRVKTTLELCKDHCSKDGCKRLVCEGLHCCKFFLFGTCKFNQKCYFGHNLIEDHNRQLLAKHFLDTLTPPQIGVLLKSGKASQVFPKVCKFYNVGEGCQFGEKGEKCRAMHVCRHYLLDDCTLGKRCKRSHNIFDAQPKNILKKHGIRIDRSPKQVLEELRAALKQDGCEDGEDLSDGEIRSSDSDDEFLGAVGPVPPRPRRRSSSSDSTSSGTKDSLEICTFFLRAKCSYGKACANKHPQYGMPYLWQYEVGREWRDLERASNDEIELNFCDPDQSECFTNNRPTGMMGINFEAMKYRLTNGESGNVRRLSTKSSQRRATNFLYLTQWHWYWKDSGGKWEEFGKHDDESITSDDLEEEFSSNPNSHFAYSADDGLEYVADLQNMKRKNRRSGSVTDIRRRPDLFDPNTKKPIRKIERQPSSPASTLSQLNIGTTYPKTWNLEFKSDNDYFQIVPVQRGQPEFETIQRLFSATIPNVPLRSVRRIQNAELWDAFHRKKTWMEKKLKPGGKLNVKSLFHGTRELYIDAICQQGFDWRISGSSVGTKYGKGSYFARDAIYSSKYTDSRKLFVVQVLVGEFAQGDARMVRPPPKDARQPFGELYDSVVNSPSSPEIFVVFTHEQAYPEYLIEY